MVWNTANDAVLAEGKRVLINDSARFDGVKVVGVDRLLAAGGSTNVGVSRPASH